MADLQAAIEDYEQTFEWKGNTYACVRRTFPRSYVIQDAGGYEEKQTVTLVVAKSLFVSDDLAPQIGDPIDLGQYQLDDDNGRDPTSPQYLFTLALPDQ